MTAARGWPPLTLAERLAEPRDGHAYRASIGVGCDVCGRGVMAHLADDEDLADDGPGAPPPTPGPSLVAGSIGRGLTDAAAAYRAELADLWRSTVEALPDD